MLWNYLKIACRSIGRNKLLTAINLIGLAMSMSLGLLILTVISDLLSYDSFHANRNSIFRIITHVKTSDGYSDMKATCPFPVANELKNNYQGYENIVRVQRFFNAKSRTNDNDILLEGYYTEPSFLRMFSFNLVKGNIHTALEKPNSIVITQQAANRIFGKNDPMNRVISMGDFGDYVISGVVEDPPLNSHLRFDVLGSLSTLKQLENKDKGASTLDSWDELFRNYVYVQNSPQVSTAMLEDNLEEIAQKSNPADKRLQLSFRVQSLANIIPGPDLSSQIGPKMSYLPIMILSGIVFLVLFSACINYTNLSLARALYRAKEVGIRKAIGGERKQVFAQFLTETFVITFLSLIVAYLIFQFIRPQFLQVVPRAAEMFTLRVTFSLVLFFIGFAIFTALLAGTIPSSVLSGINVIQALKNDTSIKTLGKINLRKVLIVFQFALSLIFIIGIIVVYRQYQFSKNYDHGFSIRNKMVVPLEGVQYARFRNEFEKNPAIKSLTGSSALIGSYQVNTSLIKLQDQTDSLSADFLYVDENFVEDLEIKLLAGKSFATTTKSRQQAVIINEQLLQSIGIKKPEDAPGNVILVGEKQFEIIGVLKDFNYVHLEEPIRNFLFLYDPIQTKYVYLSFESDLNEKIRMSLRSNWAKVSPNTNFQGISLEEFVEETYSFYHNFVKIFGFVAFLAITIGCLGLAGISLYAARSRIKEIGIRKVMGASIASILLLTSKSYLWLLFVASVIAMPVSYFLFNQLLQNGAYHTKIGIIELGLGLFILFLAGGITIFSQTWKTAISNPCKSLRTE